MEHNEDLARLEQFVEKLIDSHNRLQNENSEIQAQLEAKQQEIDELQEAVKNLQEDRSEIHDRVTGLIGRIGEWEKNFDQEDADKNSGSGDNGSQKLSKESSSLFNVNAEQSSEPAM